MQEIITYLIITTTIAFVVYKMVKKIFSKDNLSDCSSTGCNGCSLKSDCSNEWYTKRKES